MTNKPSTANPQRCIKLLILLEISGSSNGVNLLNSGAIKVGNSQISRMLNATQIPHAHQIQAVPVLPITHSTAAASGAPKASDSTSILMVSVMKRRGVTRLKPKRCSSLNLLYMAKGSPTTPMIENTAATSASWRSSSLSKISASH